MSVSETRSLSIEQQYDRSSIGDANFTGHPSPIKGPVRVRTAEDGSRDLTSEPRVLPHMGVVFNVFVGHWV